MSQVAHRISGCIAKARQLLPDGLWHNHRLVAVIFSSLDKLASLGQLHGRQEDDVAARIELPAGTQSDV